MINEISVDVCSCRCEKVLKQLNEFLRINEQIDDEELKSTINKVLPIWSEMLELENEANDDELFQFQISRAFISRLFSIFISRESLETDKNFNRELFFRCLTILVDHKKVFVDRQTTFIDSNIRLLLRIMSAFTSSVPFETSDFDNGENLDLLISMRKCIDKSSPHDDLADLVVSFIWNLSDQTILAASFVKAEFQKSINSWFANRENKFQDEKFDAPIHILHNLARDERLVEILCQESIPVFLDEIRFQQKNNEVFVHIEMVRVLLGPIEQIRSNENFVENKTLNLLMQLVLDASKEKTYRFNGTHISEPLVVLFKLSCNELILQRIFTEIETKPTSTTDSLIEFFLQQLKHFFENRKDRIDLFTFYVLINFITTLSTQQIFQPYFKENQNLNEIIQLIETQNIEPDQVPYMPITLRTVKHCLAEIRKILRTF